MISFNMFHFPVLALLYLCIFSIWLAYGFNRHQIIKIVENFSNKTKQFENELKISWSFKSDLHLNLEARSYN